MPMQDAMPGVCAAACTWGDIDLWHWAFRTVESNPFDISIDIDVLERALAMLDQDSVLSRYCLRYIVFLPPF